MTYNLPLHPICKYSCNCRSHEYLQSDFSTNHLHCGWPLRDVMKIEYAGSSTTPGPKCRQSLPIQAFQQVELVVGAEIIDIPPFGIPSNPTEQKKEKHNAGVRGARFNTIHAIICHLYHDAPHMLHTEKADPCHRAVAKFTISKFNSPWTNWKISPKVSGRLAVVVVPQTNSQILPVFQQYAYKSYKE